MRSGEDFCKVTKAVVTNIIKKKFKLRDIPKLKK